MPKQRKPSSERYKGTSKYIQYILIRCVITCLQRLPIRFAFRFGRVAGLFCWKLMKKRRSLLWGNLEIINEWMSQNSSFILDETIEEQSKEVFQRAGANLFSGLTFVHMSTKQSGEHLEVNGLDHLENALSGGKGAIILLAHQGPWEALVHLPDLINQSGIDAKYAAMYRPLNNVYLDAWFKSTRESKGTRLFSRVDGFHKPVDFLRNGGVLGILADQKMRQGLLVSHFGKEVAASPIPGLFHMRSHAPMISLSIRTVGVARWCLEAKPVHLEPGSDKLKLTRLCSQEIEKIITASLFDSFLLHNRFHRKKKS